MELFISECFDFERSCGEIPEVVRCGNLMRYYGCLLEKCDDKNILLKN